MKLNNLTVEAFRGLPELNIDIGGENLLVWGPNGTGKSGVVDALDFLFSGQISRLTGEGTQRLNLAKHGTHVLLDKKNAFVTVTVDPGDGSAEASLTRRVNDPKTIGDPDSVIPKISSIFSIAAKNQLCLTRRDMLNFVATEGSSRATRVQQLLDLSDLEKLRKLLVKTENELSREAEIVAGAAQRSESAIADHASNGIFDLPKIIESINFHRAVLSAPPVGDLSKNTLREGIVPPTATDATPERFNPQHLTSAAESIQRSLEWAKSTEFTDSAADLIEIIAAFEEDTGLRPLIDQVSLIDSGLGLLSEGTEMCPLCDKAWDYHDLFSHLTQKREKATVAAELFEKLDKATKFLNQGEALALDRIKTVKGSLKNSPDHVAYSILIEETEKWEKVISDHFTLVKTIADGDDYDPNDLPSTNGIISSGSLSTALTAAKTQASNEKPALTPEQQSWEWIIALLALQGTFEQDLAHLKRESEIAERARVLTVEFGNARDSVLNALYERVSGRFSSLYKLLHPHSEGSFEAELSPARAALDLTVGFDDGEMYPANAVHSEGHQDSMGLCLFLALREEIGATTDSLIVLDDVVMSVDADHRKKICELINTEFADTQFVITTHDRTWARQLIRSRVVSQGNTLEAIRWSLESGPVLLGYQDMWSQVEVAIADGDRFGAAAKMRRGLEEFFSECCELFRVKIVYSALGEHELGQLIMPAMEEYNRLLKIGKSAASTWGQHDVIDRVNSMNEHRSGVRSAMDEEYWAINSAVHYNKWHDLSEPELKDVIAVMKNVHDLFVCEHCETGKFLAFSGNRAKAITCLCAQNDVNLTPKPN